MRYLFTFIFLVFPMLAFASNQTVSEALSEYAWEKRQLIVFTPNLENKRFKQFKKIEKEFSADFAERFLQVWTIEANKQVSLENTPDDNLKPQDFYNHFNVSTGDFAVILIGYDQGIKLRLPVFNVDTIMGEIDQMPMRRQEIESQNQD